MHIVPFVKYLAKGLSSSSSVCNFLALSTSFLIILFNKSTPSAFKNSFKFSGLFNNEFIIFNPFNFFALLSGSFKLATALIS